MQGSARSTDCDAKHSRLFDYIILFVHLSRLRCIEGFIAITRALLGTVFQPLDDAVVSFHCTCGRVRSTTIDHEVSPKKEVYTRKARVKERKRIVNEIFS